MSSLRDKLVKILRASMSHSQCTSLKELEFSFLATMLSFCLTSVAVAHKKAIGEVSALYVENSASNRQKTSYFSQAAVRKPGEETS